MVTGWYDKVVTTLSKIAKLRGITEIGDWVLVRIVISNLKLMVYAVEKSLWNSCDS